MRISDWSSDVCSSDLCAVIGANDDLKGMVPVGLVVLKSGSGAAHDDIAREIIRRVRDELGPVAAFKSVHVVGMLPKTRSGKILRSTIRAIAKDRKSTRLNSSH